MDAGLLFGKDLLVVAATASGKTFIGEMAGMKNYLAGRGRMLFLVPLVALANQKYERFTERYGALAKTGLLTGVSRLNLPETRKVGDRNPQAPILVGTYEGVDNMIRCGQKMHNIGTVVIDEVQMLEDPERGHRLDGLVARLKYLAPQAQYLYLSATIGSPKTLAKKLNCQLVRYNDRPVALERFLLFTERKQKIPTIKKLTTEEYKNTSSKGYRGQTIIFTNARARCHTIADALGMRAAAYHAGLSAQERREVETKFLGGKLMAVVTTAALGAGVDFPASQVIFDALAMGREWLSVQEFNQMAGRAGRPDFHDLGRVVLLAEPGELFARTPGYRGGDRAAPPQGPDGGGRSCPRPRTEFGGVRGKRGRLRGRGGGPCLDQCDDGGQHGAGAAGVCRPPARAEEGDNNRALPPCPRDVGALHRDRAAAGDRGACAEDGRSPRYHRGAGERGYGKRGGAKEREGRVASRGEEGARETVRGGHYCSSACLLQKA